MQHLWKTRSQVSRLLKISLRNQPTRKAASPKITKTTTPIIIIITTTITTIKITTTTITTT